MTQDGTPNAVQIIDFNVEVKHSFPKVDIDFEKPSFSEIETFYSNKKPNPHFGILKIHSLNQKLVRLNTHKSTGKKDEDPAILKGIYNGGTSGVNCEVPAGFLFFDIDVKDNENAHLKCKLKNAEAFEAVQKYALLTWRSNSGLGIAGILYVPQLAEIGHDNTKLHLQIGNAITSHLSKELRKQNIVVSFDDAQSKFRQIRFLAEQKEKRSFNLNPALIEYTITETPRVYNNGVKAYRNADFSPIVGSIEYQFNQNNNIKDVLLQCGFENTNGERYKHPRTTSSTTGEANENLNLFFNYSGSFSSIKGFSPYSLDCYCNFNYDFKAFKKSLKEQGYKDIEPTKETVKVAEKSLRNTKDRTSADIFSICSPLQNLPLDQKRDFIKKNCKNENEKKYFLQYLKLKNLKIQYDAELKIDSYVSEVFKEILNYADEHQKVSVKAETGTGKTYSVISEFQKQRPDHRCLIIAPLTVIVDQTKKQFGITGLTGSSDPIEHLEAKTAKMVIATQEQAIKHLQNGNAFDYIVIDEMHNLLTAQSYKRNLLRELTYLLKDSKVIGLTATLNAVFTKIGYKLLSVEKRSQSRTKVIQRASNSQAYKIILEHLKTVKSKIIIRINSKKTLHDIKAELIEYGKMNESDIFLIYSEKHIKQSEQFRGMINNQQFPKAAKVILTTGVIDEGLNIYQNNFSDVVFIDSDYTPRPESLKQFLARFRNEDPSRKNYHYRKFKKDQDVKNWNWVFDYNTRLQNLEDEADGLEDFNSWNDLANDGNFYYNDHSVNKYYLGYSVTEQYFERLTIEESNEYLRLNYNLDIQIDAVEFESDISTDRSKISAKEKHEILYKRWVLEDGKNDIKQIVRKKTSSKKIQKLIEPVPFFSIDNSNPLNDEVQTYLSEFERLIYETETLHLITDINPDELLFEDEKLKNKQKYNRLILTLENRQVLDNPRTKYDHKNREKILCFLDDAMKLKTFQIRDLQKLWRKQRISNIRGYKNFYLLDLLVDNLPDSIKIVENEKEKTYSFLASK